MFADPPYFLSNGGMTCHSGRRASVHKGDWDVSTGLESVHRFNRSWLEACRDVLEPDGTIWVSGTSHVIYSVGFAMQELGFKILNSITWFKSNAPPNLSCRYFTHSTDACALSHFATFIEFSRCRSIRRLNVSMPCKNRNALKGLTHGPMSRRPSTRALMMKLIPANVSQNFIP